MVEPSSGRVGITGASGYIGGLIADRCARAGWSVVSLCRPATSAPVVGERRDFTLGQAVDPATVSDLDVLVHCAWDLALTDPTAIQEVNVEGSKQLIEVATSAGTGRIVFVSSMSAYEGTRQVYGRAKLACEGLVAAANGASVRLGLVYGDGWGGMAGSLRRLVSLPLVPLVGARSYQFTLHEDDAAEGLFALASAPSPLCGTFGLAHPNRVPFRTVLEATARRAGHKPRFVPVPWPPVYGSMRLAELAHLRLPLRADSLLGLMRPAPCVPHPEVWEQLGVPIRAFET